MPQIERYSSLPSLFFARAQALGERPFLWARRDGGWHSLSWAEVARQVAALAAALRAQGINAGDRVILLSENRPEFCIADLAIMATGAITVPTYTTNTSRDHAHVLTDSGARAAIVSTAKIATPFLPAAVQSDLRFVIAMEPLRALQGGGPPVFDWTELIAAHPADVAATAAAQNATRGDTACLIYTSGTGGVPRGVMQHHGAILCNVAGCMDVILGDFPEGEEIFLSFLPLSHAYEHSAGQFLPIGMGAQIYYAEGLDRLAANIEEVRPTIMIVVPRLFEMLRTRISRAIEKQGALPAFLLRQALAQGKREARREARGGRSLLEVPLRLLLDRTIRPRVADRFGGRLKALVSGGAPLNTDVGLFFQSLGLTLLQGYGQTEAGPVVSVNRPRAGIAMDTVGPPLKDVEVRIAGDGEILVRGELVMHGYWRNPEQTALAIRDGWLHTGDIGTFDAAGRLKITDRKKDIIVNDKGENVAPQRIEGMLTLQPEIGQAMVHGDRRPYMTALIVPDPDYAAQCEAAGTEPLPGIRAAVDRVNAGLSVTERVRRFALADEPFSILNGEMTPSLKIRRHAIRTRYGERLDALYGGE